MVSFVDSLVVGTKCLMYSAEIAGDEEDEETARKNEQLTGEERSAIEYLSLWRIMMPSMTACPPIFDDLIHSLLCKLKIFQLKKG